jgi:asparagine synthase (glutamine-hydrolysing)
MAHYLITIPKATNQAVGMTNTANDGELDSATIWDLGHKTVICWGDPASAASDADIIADVSLNRCQSYWGRSWIVVDSEEKTVQACTDRLGIFPIWIGEHQNSTALYTSRQALSTFTQHQPKTASAQRTLVAFGQLFDEQALWHEIRCLNGRTTVTIDSGRTVVESHQDTPILGNDITRFDDALEAFVEAVREAFNCDREPMVSLSGGLDSRLILSAATALGKKPTTLTYGSPLSSDHQIAKTLAECAGLHLMTGNEFATPTDPSTIQRVADLGNGEVPLHHAHSILDSSLLAQTSGRMLLTGTGAEVARAFYYDRGFPGFSIFGQGMVGHTSLMERAKRYIREEYSKSATPFFNYAPQFKETMLNDLNRIIERHAHQFDTPARFLDNFYLQNRVVRFVACGQQMLDSHYLRSHPFLNKDALYQIAHLPVRYKLASRFHRKAIQKLSPKLANIRWDKTDQPLSHGLPLSYRYPALTSRLGIEHWGKNSTPMYNYSELAKHLPRSTIERILRQMNCLNNINDDQSWQRVQQHLPTLGFSAVWSQSKPLTVIQSITGA